MNRPVVFLLAALAIVVAARAGELIPQAVSVTPVRIESISDRVIAYGNLVPVRTVNIAPQVPARVAALLFTDGQSVAAGQVLVRMDSTIAEARLVSARARLQTDLQNLQRARELTNQGVNSVEALQQAEVQAAESQSAVDVSQRTLDQLTLWAPFAGQVGTHQVDAGSFITAGETIVQLQDTNNLRIEFRMPGTVALHVREGMPVQIEMPAAAGSLVGTLSFIDPSISTDTRSVLLRATVQRPGPEVRPGFYVRVSLVIGEHPHALVVPADAIIPDLADSYVFVVDRDDVVHRRTVTLGLSDADRVELLSGVTAGDQVVTVGQFRLRDGDKVKVVPADTAAGG